MTNVTSGLPGRPKGKEAFDARQKRAKAASAPLAAPPPETEDFSAAFDGEQITSSEALNEVLRLADELVNLEIQISDLEQLMKRLSGRTNELKTSIIPDKMAELGLPEFKTHRGDKLSVEEFVGGGLPKEVERRKDALKEVENWGAEDVIKNEVLLLFDKKQHNEAMALVDDLRQKGFSVEATSGIHHQTYIALIRERLKRGEFMDAEKMGVFVGRKVKVKLAKPDAGVSQ